LCCYRAKVVINVSVRVREAEKLWGYILYSNVITVASEGG